MRGRSAALGLLGAALALRLSFFALAPVLDDGNDSYIQPALELLRSGRYDSFATLHRLPAAPWLFALIFSVFGVRPWAVTLLLHLLGVATFWLLTDSARRAWGERAGLLAGGLLLLECQIPYRECFLLSEPLAHFFLALSLNLALRLRERPTAPAWRWAAGGFAAAAAALTRGEFVVLGPLVLLAHLLPSPVHGRGGGGERSFRLIVFSATWLALVGGWVLRNQFVFGYAGLTPDTLTTLTDTALPIVRYDLPSEPLAKAVLREQVRAAAATPGLDPRPTTIERLQKEHGLSYLQAELALGRVAREAVLSRPLEYLRLASRNFVLYLLPSRWAATPAGGGPVPSLEQVAAQSPAHAAWVWLVRLSQSWDWVLLLLAVPAPLLCLRADPARRWPAALFAACYLALWTAVSLADFLVPRIQSSFYLPFALLAAFTLDSVCSSWARRWE